MSKLLIVEDDKVVSMIYVNLFKKAGFDVQAAADGQEALEAIAKSVPDIVLLDLQIPKVDGVEVLKRVRARPETRALPIIVFTNTYLGEMAKEARKHGANRCLSKAGCSTDVVLETVRSTLAKPKPETPSPGKPGSAVPAGPGVIPFPAKDEVLGAMREAERRFKSKLRRQFVDNTATMGSTLRRLAHDFVNHPDPQARLDFLDELYAKIRSLTSNAATVGLTHLAQFSSALEAMLKELTEDPEQITPSVQHTVVKTVDFIFAVLPLTPALETGPQDKPRILVVDDEPISTRMITLALEKAGLTATTTDSALTALALLERDPFDLIFMDVSMPEMDGLEACSRLRAMPQHMHTPVIFVTGHDDFETRAKSITSGGTDLIGKPFLHLELTVKALMRLWQAQLGIPEGSGGEPEPAVGAGI